MHKDLSLDSQQPYKRWTRKSVIPVLEVGQAAETRPLELTDQPT